MPYSFSSREVSYEEGKEFSIQYNLPFLETSAKTGDFVEEVLTFLNNELYFF
jgi:hypothetical protein